MARSSMTFGLVLDVDILDAPVGDLPLAMDILDTPLMFSPLVDKNHHHQSPYVYNLVKPDSGGCNQFPSSYFLPSPCSMMWKV